jgi:hypothetical protein
LKKDLVLLIGLVFQVGCGGIYNQVHQSSWSPAPAQLIQSFSPRSLDRLEQISLESPTSASGVEDRFPAEINPNAESEIYFCSPEDPSLFVAPLRERIPQNQAESADSLLPSLWKEDAENQILESPLRDQNPLPPGEDRKQGPEEAPLLAVLIKSESEKGEGPFLPEMALIKEASTFPGFSVHGNPEDYCFEGQDWGMISPSASWGEPFPEDSPANARTPSRIFATIPTELNERVRWFIDLFQTRADNFFGRSLARSQTYETMMKQILREKNLPEELFYLALIESGFNPYAQSRAKATGIWQFMAKTAKRFGLKVDKWVDERRDPEKSTYAAAEYLKNLYEIFNCWHLTAAGYNAGEGKILKAMKRAKSQDFWEISKHRYLKRETKEYVPMFLAAMIIAQDPQKYGFSHLDYHSPLLYEKVVVPPGTRLDRIARAAETDLGEIRSLNPALKRDRTPPDGNPFEIKLPLGKKEVFEQNLPDLNKLDPRTAKKHRVRRGENLAQIAKKYRISVQDLCEWNDLSPKNTIHPGLTLLLPP